MEGDRTFRAWHPVLEGHEAVGALAAVDSIADALAALPLTPSGDTEPARYGARAQPSLAGGHAGHALFFAYLSRHRPGAGFADRSLAHLDLAIELVSSAETLPNLYSGFTGVAWVAEHVRDLLQLEQAGDLTAEVDTVLGEHLDQSPWRRHFDLISGLAGYGVYALSRLPSAVAVECLERVVDRLAELAVERPHGVAWHTPPELLWPATRKEFPNGYDDLGVAHGVPGVVAVLAQIWAAGITRTKIRPLVDGAVSWIDAQRLAPGHESAFPYQVTSGGAAMTTRAAWCYGDPGIACALLVAARALGEPAWERRALEIASFAARRSPATAGIRDACLCHGSAGLAHLVNGWYQVTGDELFRDRARFWFRQALDFRRPDRGCGGFLAWDLNPQGEMEWLGVPGFLTGAAGVGLALLAAATSHEPRWDEVLLASPVSTWALPPVGDVAHA